MNDNLFLLIDEITLIHDGPCGPPVSTTQIPNLCNEPCEYVAIDCHNYYSCINFEHKEYFTCPEEQGLAFNPALGVCDFAENVEGCYPSGKCKCEYRPHPENCQEFCYFPDTCRVDKCELRRCPVGLLWSLDAKGDGSGHQQCVLARNVECPSDQAVNQ